MPKGKKPNEYSNMAIALNISHEIMTHSVEPLILTVTHPCGEQYECIAIMKNPDCHAKDILINLRGESISVAGKLIRPYQELYKIDKQGLICEITGLCGLRLTSRAVREIPAMRLIIKLINSGYDVNKLKITSAWYDGSYSSKLDTAAKDFSYYKYKGCEDRLIHLPWWSIAYSFRTLAMINLETNELIIKSGKRYDLYINSERGEAFMEMEKDIRLIEVEDTAFQTMKLIRDNDEWISRYKEYSRIITENLGNINQTRKAFREWSPLKFYLNVTNAKKASSGLNLGVRYLGQEVAELILRKESDPPLLNTMINNYDKKNAENFNWHNSLNNVDWRGEEAKAFRSYFKNNPPRIETNSKRNEEHRIESLLLSEFSKHKSLDKALSYIQPIKIGGIRFPMPTPISASNHKAVKYSKDKGGGIDIFTRVGKSGKSAKLCVIELKDENKKNEPAMEVIKQAVAYATFIRELLRSDFGYDWWKLFGFNKPIPKKLTILAACAMPSTEKNDYSFANKEIKIEEDIISLHCIYFREVDNKIIDIESSLNY